MANGKGQRAKGKGQSGGGQNGLWVLGSYPQLFTTRSSELLITLG